MQGGGVGAEDYGPVFEPGPCRGQGEADVEGVAGRGPQALGLGADVNVVVSFADLKPGDVILVCSDGLSEKVTAEEMRDTVGQLDNVADACARLVSLARERGGEDNITVVVGRFDGEREDASPRSP